MYLHSRRLAKEKHKRELKMKLLFLSFVGLSLAGTKCSGDMCWARGPRYSTASEANRNLFLVKFE